MDGFSFATDGERAANPRPQIPTAADRVSMMSDAVFSAHGISHATPAWIRDHEAIYTWLRAIPNEERATFLVRIAANIETLERTAGHTLEPSSADATLAHAVLIEYAQHLGVSLPDACYILQQRTPLDADPLLGVRVDNMLADAAARRELPRHRGDDTEPPSRFFRGMTSSGRANPGRRGRSSQDNTPPLGMRPSERIRRAEPGRTG